MAKIIEITESMISIGMDDHSIREVRPDEVAFEPHIGDEVEIYETDTRTIVQKKETPSKQESAEDGSKASAATQPTSADGKVVSKTTYCVLAILLGNFGLHRFYAGRIGLGVFYLVFCWTGIPAILGLVDGISALCKIADADGNIVV